MRRTKSIRCEEGEISRKKAKMWGTIWRRGKKKKKKQKRRKKQKKVGRREGNGG